MGRFGLAFAAALVAMALAAAAASASSIVFTKDDGNIWLAHPDGSGQYQVTLDGSASDPYEGPSQADDGTIVAARGSGSGRKIYRMRQNGALLNDPIGTVGVADEPRIAPNGSLVAYWFLTPVSYSDCFYCIGTYDQSVYTYPDRLTRFEEVNEPHCCEQPSWMANNGVFLTNGSGTAWYHLLGDSEAKQWFTDYQTIPSGHQVGFRDGEVSPGLDRLALLRGDSQETIQLYQLNGPPPAQPTPGCAIIDPPGGKFIGPTWSPDGQQVAWEDASGIAVSNVPSVSDCATIGSSAHTIIPGAHKPDWGPADVNPGPRPAPGGGPGTGPSTGPTSGGGDRTAPKIALKLIGKQRLRKVLKNGYAAFVRSNEVGAGGLELFLGRKRVALGTKAFRRAGASNKLVAKFTKKARRQLARRRSVRLKLRVIVIDAAENPAVKTKAIKLVR